jgi:diguanylate cyclase (GGDEF)-like protein
VRKPGIEGEILVVDDDPRFQEFVERVVGRLGLSCTFSRFGEDAIRKLGERNFRMLVLDGLLPGMRGEDVAKRVRETYGPKELPILFCSAFYRDLRSFRYLMNECGVTQILHKPVDEGQLLETVRKILDLAVVAEAAGSEDWEALQASYLAGSLERVAAMQRALQALGGADPGPSLTALQIEAHRFRGSGASFDLPEISRVGGTLEDMLRGLGTAPKQVSGPFRAKLEGLVDALESALRHAAGTMPLAPSRLQGLRPRVLLVEEAPSRLGEEIPTLEAEGQPIWLCSEADDALRRVIEHQVEVVFVAADGPKGLSAALPTCRALRDIAQVAVVVIAKNDSVGKRLEALEAGARGYVPRPADVAGLFRIASIHAKTYPAGPVLLVGEDPKTLEDLAGSLADLGRGAVPCSHRDDLFRLLDRTTPSLVILDADPILEEGLALVRAIRGDLRYRALPLLVASETWERSQIVDALASGASACLPKPVTLLELQPLLASWVVDGWEREQGLFGLDAQTGLMDRRRFEMSLEQGLSLARREGHVLSVIGIDAGLGGVAREAGGLAREELASVLADQLVGALRASDVVARVGGDRFFALLPGAKEGDAARIAEERIQAFVTKLGPFAEVATPVAATRTFPDARDPAARWLDTLDRALEEKLGKEDWDRLVVEVEDAPA